MEMVANGDDGETPGSLLFLLSFNTFHMSDFARLVGLLRNHRPHLAFIQEVSHFSSLSALAAVAGYSAYLSNLPEAA
jgi:hypothetical protein